MSTEAMGDSASLHGSNLLKRGFTVAQVVHDYGGVCQAVTELADETNAHITADEFHTFNRCLDDAIAQAVTEFTRQRELSIADQGTERSGNLAHELRNAPAPRCWRTRLSEWGASVLARAAGRGRGRCNGLPPGKADALFGAFEQRGRDRTGLGLGLSISRKSIEADGGEIRVRDMPGRGCIFVRPARTPFSTGLAA